MADLCSRSEQCTNDILNKLLKAGLTRNQSEEIIDFLVLEKFISDRRFAKAYANDKLRFSGWGKYKIRTGLYLKHIPSDLITEAIDNLNEDTYKEVLQKVGDSKAKGLSLTDRKNAQKLYRHLLSRGFESSDALAEVKRQIRIHKEC